MLSKRKAGDEIRKKNTEKTEKRARNSRAIFYLSCSDPFVLVYGIDSEIPTFSSFAY